MRENVGNVRVFYLYIPTSPTPLILHSQTLRFRWAYRLNVSQIRIQ